MLRFRSERLSIALCPGQVAVLTSKRGPQGARAEPVVLAVAEDHDVPLWKNSVAVLADWLQQQPPGRASATLLVSNRFVRFARVPWVESAQGEAEAQALAMACFESQYGDMRGWRFQLDDGAFGAPRLAFAMEGALLDALQAVFDARKIPCPRVEPYFVTCWNRWHTELKTDEALFAVMESGTMVMASLKSGRWHSVRTLGGHHEASELAGLMNRESLLQGLADAPGHWLHAPVLDQASLAAMGGTLHVLSAVSKTPAPSHFSAAQHMALVGEQA